jgi:hypothetical protein
MRVLLIEDDVNPPILRRIMPLNLNCLSTHLIALD